MRWFAIITALGAMTLMPAPLAAQNTTACSAAALPEAERRAMETRFQQIAQRQGRAAAETYAREQAHAFRQRLIAEGVCSENDAPQPSPRQPPHARPSPPASRITRRGAQMPRREPGLARSQRRHESGACDRVRLGDA